MGQTLRRTGPQMKRSGGAIAPAVLAKKKAPARDILIDEPETDELRAFGGSRSDKFNGVLINAMARTGFFPPGQTDEACIQQMFAAVAALRAFKPTDEIEGMLAAQTVGAYDIHSTAQCGGKDCSDRLQFNPPTLASDTLAPPRLDRLLESQPSRSRSAPGRRWHRSPQPRSCRRRP